ncbi:MAG: DUF2237 domain-containing protein [Chloroflexota bacterium]
MATKNVLGTELETCSLSPLTGFFRDGMCETCEQDFGVHTVCAVMTDEFLEYGRARGNDLITARPEYRFPGLKAGDRWCICLSRWIEAYNAGVAPQIVLESTHESMLDHVSMKILQQFSSEQTPPRPSTTNGYHPN